MTLGTKVAPIGVVLMSYGSAVTPEDVPAYLARIRGGRPAPDGLVAEFQKRYRVIGGSPLIRITLEQAAALETLLNAQGLHGRRFKVVVGMRHSPPWISDALSELVSVGAKQVIAIILSPQYSPIIMGGYHKAVDESKSVLGPIVSVKVAGGWHLIPSFLNALALRIRQALDRFSPEEKERIPLVLTAHSLPKAVVDRDPGYIQQLLETASAVAERIGLNRSRWEFAYQSAGHTPEEWLKPDLSDVLLKLAGDGHRRVLVVPIQFLSDHLETLYAIDVAARAQAEEAGLTLYRIEMFNTMPGFIQALADVVYKEMSQHK